MSSVFRFPRNPRLLKIQNSRLLVFLFFVLFSCKNYAAWDHGMFPSGTAAKLACDEDGNHSYSCYFAVGSNPVCPGDQVKYFYIYVDSMDFAHHFAYCPPYSAGKKNGPDPISHKCEGDPCDPSTGNNFQTETDIHEFPHAEPFTRFYNSVSSVNKSFGYGWTATYFQSLDISGSTVTVTRPTGRGETFVCNNYDAMCSGDADSFYKLKKNNGAYTLTLPDDSIEIYDVNGKLRKIKSK